MSCKLIHGDCISEMNNLIDEGIKVDMVLTDPPYGTTRCKWDSIIPFDEMWDCIHGLVKERTPVLLFGNEPFSSLLRVSNLDEYKYDYRCSDKDKVTEIIQEELARSDEHKDEDHLKWAVKRRCQAEAL